MMAEAYLTIPTVAKEEKMYTIKYDIECQPSGDEELPVKPAFAHDLSVFDYFSSDLCMR
jgi:hypothetical protein